MNKRTLTIAIVTFAIISCLLMTTAQAYSTWPSLPSSTVEMTVVDGQNSYFIITLSSVPYGYSISNKAYTGWCLDRAHLMTRNTSLCVTLYSSLNPPESLSNIQWDKINYVLNHKVGSADDVQIALWYFSDWWSYASIETYYPNAKIMVDDANAHLGFVPKSGDVVAVICLPCDSNQQLAIIEIGQCCCRDSCNRGLWNRDSCNCHSCSSFLRSWEHDYCRGNSYSDSYSSGSRFGCHR